MGKISDVKKGAWVEIRAVVLREGERAPHVPEDTWNTPLEMRAKGYLLKDSKLGEAVEILTPTSRTVKGVLHEVNPAYTHGFGEPLPELLSIGAEVRSILREKGLIK